MPTEVMPDPPGPSPTPTPSPASSQIEAHARVATAFEAYALEVKNATDRAATLGDISKLISDLASILRIEAET